jgi:hypothetical protein
VLPGRIVPSPRVPESPLRPRSACARRSRGTVRRRRGCTIGGWSTVLGWRTHRPPRIRRVPPEPLALRWRSSERSASRPSCRGGAEGPTCVDHRRSEGGGRAPRSVLRRSILSAKSGLRALRARSTGGWALGSRWDVPGGRGSSPRRRRTVRRGLRPTSAPLHWRARRSRKGESNPYHGALELGALRGAGSSLLRRTLRCPSRGRSNSTGGCRNGLGSRGGLVHHHRALELRRDGTLELKAALGAGQSAIGVLSPAIGAEHSGDLARAPRAW